MFFLLDECPIFLFVFDVFSGKIPVRLYVRTVSEDFEDLEDMPKIDSWDKISYINRPIEIHREGRLYLFGVCECHYFHCLL